MALRQMRALQLEPAKVETAADFLETYASYILSQGAEGSASEVSLIDAASSLRSAGQWAMLFDTQRAMDLLTRAAEIWHDMGHGFGTFILAAITPRQLNRSEMIDRLVQTAQLHATNDVSRHFGVRRQRTLEPLLHPQQQTYLFLAGVAVRQQLDVPLELLEIVGNQSPNRQGVQPIGALGMPIRMYWNIARTLLEVDGNQSAATVARDLAGMGTAYAQSINSAMANERLWFNAAAPVDVGGLDIVAISLAASRRLGRDLMRSHLRSTAEGLDAIARVPLDLATEMIDSESPPADEEYDLR